MHAVLQVPVLYAVTCWAWTPGKDNTEVLSRGHKWDIGISDGDGVLGFGLQERVEPGLKTV